MKKVGIYKGIFDPILEAEVQEAREWMKQEKLSKVYFLVEEKEGLLPFYTRRELVLKGIKRYRHLDITHEIFKDAMIKESTFSYEKVHQGNFNLASCGIRRTLVEEGYYFEEILDYCCKESRANHSKQVALYATSLAKHYGVNDTKAYQAGLLHDITKNLADEENQRWMQLYEADQMHYSNKVWHGFTAIHWLRKNLGLYDRDILDAIYHHTLGDGKSLLCKIIFIADKCEPTRRYDTSIETALAYRDINACVQLIKEETKEYLKTKEEL